VSEGHGAAQLTLTLSSSMIEQCGSSWSVTDANASFDSRHALCRPAADPPSRGPFFRAALAAWWPVRAKSGLAWRRRGARRSRRGLLAVGQAPSSSEDSIQGAPTVVSHPASCRRCASPPCPTRPGSEASFSTRRVPARALVRPRRPARPLRPLEPSPRDDLRYQRCGPSSIALSLASWWEAARARRPMSARVNSSFVARFGGLDEHLLGPEKGLVSPSWTHSHRSILASPMAVAEPSFREQVGGLGHRLLMPSADADLHVAGRIAWSRITEARTVRRRQTLFTVSEETSLGMPPLIWAWRRGDLVPGRPAAPAPSTT